MNTIIALLTLLFLLPATPADSRSTRDHETVAGDKDAKVTVYYFHTSRRCKTCLSIERVAKRVVREQYGGGKDVVFRAVNIEKEENAALAEKYEVGGSALLVCRGKKTKDLTAKAFQYGLNDPAKLQALLIETVDAMRKG